MIFIVIPPLIFLFASLPGYIAGNVPDHCAESIQRVRAFGAVFILHEEAQDITAGGWRRIDSNFTISNFDKTIKSRI
jgi:hypothetical protein